MPLGLRAGELDDRIILEQDTADKQGGQDADFGAEVENWVEFATVWADFNPLGGQEFFAAQQRQAKRQATFTIRHLDGVNELMRIQFDGDTWDIQRLDLVGRKDKMVLFAHARGD